MPCHLFVIIWGLFYSVINTPWVLPLHSRLYKGVSATAKCGRKKINPHEVSTMHLDDSDATSEHRPWYAARVHGVRAGRYMGNGWSTRIRAVAAESSIRQDGR